MPNCKNHPERSARRRCFQCKDPICPSCQMRRDGHIFCSESCRSTCRRVERRQRIGVMLRRFQRHVDPRIWWRYPPFIREAWARRVMVFAWVLLASQVAVVGVVWILAERSGPIADQPGNDLPRGVSEPVAEPVQEPRQPYWVEPPRAGPDGLSATAAAGDQDAVVLVDGQLVARIPAGERRAVELPRSTGPRAWSLQPAALHASVERWTVASGGAPGINQVPETSGVAITFDGGWRADHADEILKTLREHRVQATFFLTGQFLQNYPDTTRRIVGAGHEVGNHTWSHLHLTTFGADQRHATRPGVDRQRLQWELLRTEALFYRITGQAMAPKWRAPFGEINEQIEQWARELGYRHVGWTSHGSRDRSLDTLDWVVDPDSPLFVTGTEMAQHIVDLTSTEDFAGGIVLMHLGGGERPDPIHQHLGAMIGELRERGIPLRRVSELLEQPRETFE